MIKPIVDMHYRDKIEQELDQTFLVEAGAGSGKTTSLVKRMVNIVRTGTYNIDEIAAITFTRKAAEELKTRFQTKLEKEWKDEADVKAKKNLEMALTNIDQCFLGTVHSFCARLLRERPVEAKLDLQFQELEEAEDRELAQLAWNLYFDQLRLHAPEKMEQIENLGIPYADLRKSFLNMKSYPDVEWVYENKYKPDIVPVYQALLLLLKTAKHAIPDDAIEGRYDDLQNIILKAIRKDKFENSSSDSTKINIFELFNKKLSVTQKLWRSKEDAKHFLGQISDFIETTVKPLLEEWYEYAHGQIIPLLKDVMVQYETLKTERSYTNFQDLLMKTAYLLKENAEVRSYFGKKYRCLLVDEFQDTDPIQAEIMFYLTGEDETEKNWTKCKPKRGSLFVVGDPKQAIYRFRRADIDIYNKVKELITYHGGEVLELTMNFRTLDTVTEQLNAVFSQKLPEKASEYQASYKPLHSFFEDDQSTFSGIQKLVIPKEYTNKEGITQFDSEKIAATIQAMIQKGHEPREFMILTRYNENLDLYYRALIDKEVPASLSGEVVLAELEVFQELVHLLTFIQDPSNQVQLLAVLRGAFFGYSDQQLYDWKQAGGRFSVYATVPEELDERTKEIFLSCFEKLKIYVGWKRTFSPSTVVEKIIEDIGLYPLLITRGYGAGEYQALMQIISAVRSISSFNEMMEALKELIFSSTTVVNMEGDGNAVRVMNVHKAKGLEARIVFLANPGKKVDMEDRISYHIRRTEEGADGYFIFKKPNGYSSKTVAQPPSWETFKQEEYRYLIEEETRILYVAATRAEKALVVSTCEKNNKKNPWQELVDIIKPEELIIEEVKEIENLDKTFTAITEQDFDKVHNIENWVTKHLEPSYVTFSPTDEKQEIYTLNIEREEGGGKTWGTMVHETFEMVVKGIRIEEQLPRIFKKHGISLDRQHEVLAAIHQFKNTEVWAQILQAKLVLTEAPFTIKMMNDDPLYETITKGKDVNHPIIVSGVIDLAYQLAGKWIIVDYKTDRPKDPESISVLTSYYQHQIGLYKDVWERITGSKVQDAILYFVTMDQLNFI